MAQRVTLRQAVELLKQQGIDVEWNDLTLEDFFIYFDHHYKADCENGTFPRVSFFFTDILEIFR